MKEQTNPITRVILYRDSGTHVSFGRDAFTVGDYNVTDYNHITTASLGRLTRALNGSMEFSGQYYSIGNGWVWYRDEDDPGEHFMDDDGRPHGYENEQHAAEMAMEPDCPF